MNEQDKNLALLPSGFADLLPPDAAQEAEAVAVLMGKLQQFGYERVKPPLVEFEDSLFATGPGAALTEETFRLMDPASHRMMGLRSDITAQIARIASSRMAQEERPLRLMYANDVLRTRGSGQRTERQFCQVGGEIIGPDLDEADVEICTVALSGLAALDITNVTLDLSLPRFVENILSRFSVADENKDLIRQALFDKDVERLQALEGDVSEVLVELLQAAGPVERAVEVLESMNLSQEIKQDLDKLRRVCQGVKKAVKELGLKNVLVSVDPVEVKELQYYQGIAFSLFAEGVREEIGGGGRYNVVFGESDRLETASGFTLYMNVVRKAMSKPVPQDTVFVPTDENWNVISSLQDDGWIVVRGTGQDENCGRCTHEYKDGKVQKIG